ncbi:hypothetical protein H2248_009819 [Termitomyces sp. 'cryptogamus']|nr:hypothetical protein H2248_009819 [Termitomyces sp. 'cryptogamus']
MPPRSPGYNLSSPHAYSPTSPSFMPQSPYGGATSPFRTSPYATYPSYDCSRGPTSPTYSSTSPELNLTSPGYSQQDLGIPRLLLRSLPLRHDTVRNQHRLVLHPHVTHRQALRSARHPRVISIFP